MPGRGGSQAWAGAVSRRCTACSLIPRLPSSNCSSSPSPAPLRPVQNNNLLLLDEPTNHLDIEAIDSLADAIKRYDGGMVLVSHDFRLIDQVAKEIWVCEDKKVRRAEVEGGRWGLGGIGRGRGVGREA